MDKPELFSRATLDTATAHTIRQLEELWSILTWPEKPLPVLDVGCGPGDVAAKFLATRVPKGTHIVACDVNPEMVQYAKEHNSVPGVITHELFDVMDKDLQKTAVWKHGPYSKVFALMLLHWLPDNRGAIQNMHKLLAPGGEAIFVVIPKIALWSVYEEMVKDPRWKQYMEDYQRFISPYQHSDDPAAELKQLLQDEGFRVLHSWHGPMAIEYKTEQDVRDMLVSVNAFLNRIPKEQKEDFIEDVLQGIYRLNGLRKEEDGSSGETKMVYSYMSMVVVGRKI